MTYSPSYIHELTRASFRQEAEELLSELDATLLALEASPNDTALLNRAFRAMHTLKGSGATAGFHDVSAMLHDVENIFNLARDGRAHISSAMIDLLFKIEDVINRMLVATKAESPALLAAGMELAKALNAEAPTGSAQRAPIQVPIDEVTAPDLSIWAIRFAPVERIFHTGNDPMSFLNDVLSLGHGVVRADTTRLPCDEASFDPELCYLAWDIQLATTAPRQQLVDVFAFVEDEAEVRIDPVAQGKAWILPAEAYFEAETINDFRDEAREDVAEMETRALALEDRAKDPGHFGALKRSLHNLKGLCGLLLSDATCELPARHPIRAMSALCHAAETSLESFPADAMEVDEATCELFLETVDALKAQLRAMDAPCEDWPTKLFARLGVSTPPAPQKQLLAPPPMAKMVLEQCDQVVKSVASQASTGVPATSWQMIGRALDTLAKALQVNGSPADTEEANALSGACLGSTPPDWASAHSRYQALHDRVLHGGNIITNMTPSVVGAVASMRPIARTISLRPASLRPPVISRRPEKISRSSQPRAKSGAPVAAGAPVASAANASAARSVRVDQDKLDFLMGAVGELLVAKNALPVLVARARSADRQSGKEIKETVDRIAHIADDLQNAMRQIRMMPIRSVFQRFPRMIRDLARGVQKQVQLIISGDETELDKVVLEQIGDPLVHLVRNAVDHGIELPEEREAKGKLAMGTVGLEVLKEGSNVIIRITDDGRGMDPNRLKKKAVDKGLLSASDAAAMSDARALELIFLPGFSTAEKVTDISDRGVGMDVVQSNIKKLHGTVSIASELGRGSVMSIKLPSSLMVSKGMLVECTKEQYVLPIERVREMVKIRKEEVRRFRGVAMANIRGSICPVFSLSQLLGLDGAPEAFAGDKVESNAAIVSTGSGEIAVLVDRLVAEIDVVVKPLSGGLDKLSVFQGATILGDGTVALILDLGKLDVLVGQEGALSADNTDAADAPDANDGKRAAAMHASGAA
jgi:two-component system chemotaxis sensor kinase CheA